MNTDNNFRNMVDDPYLRAAQAKKNFKNCCGLAATGDGAMDDAQLAEQREALPATKVRDMQAWNYAKTALAIVGAWVVLKWAYEKIKK